MNKGTWCSWMGRWDLVRGLIENREHETSIWVVVPLEGTTLTIVLRSGVGLHSDQDPSAFGRGEKKFG